MYSKNVSRVRQIMIEHGFPTKLIRLIRATLVGSKLSVRVTVSSSFVTLDGLKQSVALSNILFNVALEGAIRRAGVQRSGIIAMRSHMLLGFADDIDIVGKRRSFLEEGDYEDRTYD